MTKELFEDDDKSTPIVWLKELDLSREQRELMAMLINIFGGEDGKGHYFHPNADSDNLGKFSVTFLKEVLANETLILNKSKQDANILAILESVELILKKY